MAQPPTQRALFLANYFANEYGFEAERFLSEPIVFKRLNGRGVFERIVVKHAQVPVRPGEERLRYSRRLEFMVTPRDEKIKMEEIVLRTLWGSEHIPQILSIVNDPYHLTWREPPNRPLYVPFPNLPWKLDVGHPNYNNALDFPFFVMEYLPRGSGSLEADSQNLLRVGRIIHQLAVLDEGDGSDHNIFRCAGIPNFREFETYASQEFFASPRFSIEFKTIICRLMAAEFEDSVYLRSALSFCSHNVEQNNIAMGNNRRGLEDEVNEIFDVLPDNDDDDDSSDEDYVP
ncbi:hypothetical protein F4803DRAFT_572030 [Xylaria telfairii]|nr:hypothetical protein F4803DRAFT_572030 [Xylaria telfairii]